MWIGYCLWCVHGGGDDVGGDGGEGDDDVGGRLISDMIGGFDEWQTDRLMDIYSFKVTFSTENDINLENKSYSALSDIEAFKKSLKTNQSSSKLVSSLKSLFSSLSLFIFLASAGNPSIPFNLLTVNSNSEEIKGES